MTRFYFFVFLVFFSFNVNSQVLQTVRGSVFDKESQSALPGASIAVLEEGKILKSTTSDENGVFMIKDIEVGRKQLIVRFFGYLEFNQTIVLISAKESVLNIKLEESIESLEAVEVLATEEGEVSNEHAVVSVRQFSVEETERYAGSRGDPARMASNYAGVQGADDSRNDIVVRGNSPLGVLWRVEGIDIPNPSHFAIAGTSGGAISILNNKVMANSDFYTGAFPAEYGNSLAGVFDLKLRNGNNQKHEYTAQVGLFGAELSGEGPLSKKSGASYLFVYKYSTFAVFKSLGIDLGTDAIPHFQDMTFKMNFPLKKGGNLSLFGIGGVSNIDIKISEQKDTTELDKFAQNDRDQNFGTSMAVLGATYSKSLNDKSYFKSSFAYSRENQKAVHNFITRDVNADGTFHVYHDSTYKVLDYAFNQSKLTNHTSINTKLNKKNTLKVGVNTNYYLFNFKDSAYIRSINEWQKRWNHQGGALLLQPYIQWKYRASAKTTLLAGWHAQYFSQGNALSVIEPRLGLKHQLSKTQSLSFGTGIHSQIQPTYTYFYSLPENNGKLHNDDMNMSKSAHAVIGYDNAFSKSFRMKSEVYYQELWDVPVQSYSSAYSIINQGSGFSRFFPDTLVNEGTGTNYGLELTLEKFFSKKFFFLTTASLYNSTYKGSDGVERNTGYNGKYALNVLGGFEKDMLKHATFSFGSKLTMAGGKRYGDVDTLASAEKEEVIFKDENFNAYQFKNYFRLDFKISWKVNRPKVTHEIAIDLVNMLGTKNLLNIIYTPDANDIFTKNYQLGFLPIFYYKIDF